MTKNQKSGAADNQAVTRSLRRHRRQRTTKTAWSDNRSMRENRSGWGYTKRRSLLI